MRDRTTRYALAAILLTGTVAGAVAAAQQNAPVPFPSAEEVADRGFAVWPEDTVEEARDACDTRTADEPWRLTPEGVVSRFASDVMNHEEPEIDDEFTDMDEDSATIWLYPPRELATIITLTKADECWFITHIDFRETTSSSLDYTFDGEVTTAYLVDGRFKQLGFGTEQREKPEGNVLRWRFEGDVSREGHFLAIGFRRGIGTIAAADAVPPPPTPRSGAEVFPPSEDAIWDDLRESGRIQRCRYQPNAGTHPEGVVNNLLQWEFARAMPDGPYPDVLHRGEDGPIGRRVERYRRSPRRWLLVVDGIRFDVRLKEVMDRCWAIQSLDALNRGPVLRRAWVNGDQTSIEVRPRWEKVGVRLLYGSEGDYFTVRPGVGLGMSDADIGPVDENGFDGEYPGLLSAFVVERGRYRNAEIRRLPPLE